MNNFFDFISNDVEVKKTFLSSRTRGCFMGKKRYYIALLVVTLVLTLVSLCTMWFAPENYLPVMPLLV